MNTESLNGFRKSQEKICQAEVVLWSVAFWVDDWKQPTANF
jgi:hypothetical protein